MRKRSHRKVRPVHCPTLAAMYLNPEMSLTERLSVEAFAGGWATEYHFNVLADCRDMLTIAARRSDDAATLGVCEMGLVALGNVKERYLTTGRLGATGDELQALRVLVDVAEDFWKRQGGGLFVFAQAALERMRGEAGRVVA